MVKERVTRQGGRGTKMDQINQNMFLHARPFVRTAPAMNTCSWTMAVVTGLVLLHVPLRCGCSELDSKYWNKQRAPKHSGDGLLWWRVARRWRGNAPRGPAMLGLALGHLDCDTGMRATHTRWHACVRMSTTMCVTAYHWPNCREGPELNLDLV